MTEAASSDVCRPVPDVYCWIEQDSSVMLKAITQFADPVELTSDEARDIATVLLSLADRLDPGSARP